MTDSAEREVPMNKQRCRDIKAVMGMLETLQALQEEISERLTDIMGEEQEALENLPESLQESERGLQMQEYIDTLENQIEALSEFDIADIFEELEEIVGA